MEHNRTDGRYSRGGTKEEAVLVAVTKVLKRRPINREYLRASIPMEYLPFYLYGTKTEMHMDHMLIETPSMQLSGDRVIFTAASDVIEVVGNNIGAGLVAILFNSDGSYMPPPKEIHLLPIFHGQDKSVKIYKDPNTTRFDGNTLKEMLKQTPLATGKIRFTENVLLDRKSPNQTPVPSPNIRPLTNSHGKPTNVYEEGSEGKMLPTGKCDIFINMLRKDLGLPDTKVPLSRLFSSGS